MTTRLDVFLVAGGYTESRNKAKALLEAGAVTVNGKVVTKPSTPVAADAMIDCDTSALPFVGRGGYKLEKALRMSACDPTGLVVMDIGASTGGFTDCLLQAGAARVYAVDVGTGQLHPSLRADARVTVLENTDIRDPLLQERIPLHTVELCAVDVSFISLTAVLPAALPFLHPGATVLALIKPQFEAGHAAVGKGGVVRDAATHCRVLETLLAFFPTLGLTVTALDFSPVTGGEGNIEFLAVLVYTDTYAAVPRLPSVRSVVEKAHTSLKRSRR